MELTFLLVHPLPSRLTWCEAIELVGDVLTTLLICVLIAIPTAAKDDALAGAFCFDAEFDHLVNPSALLTAEGNLVLPQAHGFKLEVF